MSVAANPYSQYRQAQVQTATPEQLVLMLYDGAIKFCLQASDCLARGELAGVNQALLRVQDIIDELHLGVNDEAGEIAAQLNSIYDYLRRRAVEANMQKNQGVIDELLSHLRELRSTWAEAIILARHQGGGGAHVDGRV